MGLANTVRAWTVQAIKTALFETRAARMVGPRYAYNFQPAQLAFLCTCLDEVADIPGCVVEAGCFAGETTVFLNAHMSASGIEKPYYALDTFSGFLETHKAYERHERQKGSGDLTGFAMNSQRWFDRSMAVNGIRRVTSMKADVGTFEFERLAPIAFCLLDVDLYLPTKAALPRLYSCLAPGGRIVVDDCLPDNLFDGAHQAYSEFVAERGTLAEIVNGKLGVLRKPRGDHQR